MNLCPGVQHGAHGDYAHHCIGTPGHPGPHWCLLGHIWEADK